MSILLIKDRPGTDQTLKLVSYDSFKEFDAKQESAAFNAVLVHLKVRALSLKPI